MQRLILILLAVAVVGVVVGHLLRGSWGTGLILGAMVGAAAWEWRQLRRKTDTPDVSSRLDRLGIYIVFMASALALWPEVEAWIARVLDN
jgi:NhaP-type Na+/H+ or K+/H+ antiporter